MVTSENTSQPEDGPKFGSSLNDNFAFWNLLCTQVITDFVIQTFLKDTELLIVKI